jgi:hypothetical protein
MTKSSADDTKYYQGGFNRSPGIASVGSYQVAGRPFLTGSSNLDIGDEDKIKFPNVTKEIFVQNNGKADLRVHFVPQTSTNKPFTNFVLLNRISGSVRMGVKCRTVYVSNASAIDDGNYNIYAELTGIEPGMMFALTGSGISE